MRSDTVNGSERRMYVLNKRKEILLCFVLMFTVSLCGCGSGRSRGNTEGKKEIGNAEAKEEKEAGMPRFYFGVEGAELKVFSAIDYTKLEQVTKDVENAKTYRGDDIEKVEGVYLTDVLKFVGASEYSSVMLTSFTGETIEYTSEMIEDPDTLLVFMINGDTLWGDKGVLGAEGKEMVHVLALGFPEDLWLWQLKEMTVNP